MSNGDKSDQKVIYIHPTSSSYGGDTHTLTEGYETKKAIQIEDPPIQLGSMHSDDDHSDSDSEIEDDIVSPPIAHTDGGAFVQPSVANIVAPVATSSPTNVDHVSTHHVPVVKQEVPSSPPAVSNEVVQEVTPEHINPTVHESPASVTIRSPSVREDSDDEDNEDNEGYMSGGDASSSISSVSTSKLFECDPMYIRLTQFLQASNGDNISNVLMGIQQELKRLNDHLQKEKSSQ